MRTPAALLGLALAATALAPPARAELIYPTADGYGVDRPPFGPFDALVLGGVLNVSDTQNLREVAALEFLLPDLGPGSVVESATLTLTALGAFGGPVVQVHGYAGDGVIDLGDLDASNLLAATGPIAGAGAVALDVTAFVRSLAQGGMPYAGFVLRTATPDSSVTFYAVEEADVGLRPVLDVRITAVPEPGGLTLLGLGGVAVAAAARARRRSRDVVAAGSETTARTPRVQERPRGTMPLGPRPAA